MTSDLEGVFFGGLKPPAQAGKPAGPGRARGAEAAAERAGAAPHPERGAEARAGTAAPGARRRAQAMEPAAADFYEEDGKALDFYDFEPLPTLPEDEENVSLADILSLRDSGLSEREAWAVCLECSLSMRSVAHSALFQTLLITPDTLAFNTSGNVCFMEQLSDDPEGAFVPPEFDVTGNTFEAHIYSLGATLKAAVDYVAEPELEPTLSPDLEALLGRMQAEEPRDRPDLESVIALCEEKVPPAASCRLCRSLSAVGRRVLSIEAFGAFQDVSESAWRGRLASRSGGPLRQPGGRSPKPEALPPPEGLAPKHPDSPEREPLKPSPSALASSGEGGAPKAPRADDGLAGLLLDSRGPLGELDGGPRRSRLRKVQTVPRLLDGGPEADGPCLLLPGALDTRSPLPLPGLPPPDYSTGLPEGRNGPPSCKAQPQPRPWPQRGGAQGTGGAERGGPPPGSPSHGGAARSPRRPEPEGAPPPHGAEEAGPLPQPASPQDAGLDAGGPGTGRGAPEEARGAGSTASEQAWVSLQDLLSKLGRSFKEHELWALCHECLRTLQAGVHFPAHLCLDSVLVAEDGTVLFGPPRAHGSYNSFFLAPEVAEGKLATEKASVYCAAAVLWAAAKFKAPRNHKLALPCRLKSLLLDMARRHPQERPSAAEAVKVCSSYLLQRGMDGKKVLAHLRASTCQVYQEEEAIGLHRSSLGAEPNPSAAAPPPEPSLAFVPVGSDAQLVAVPGHLPSSPAAPALPEAFISPATHFKPIVLAQDTGAARDGLVPGPGLAGGPEEEQVRLAGEAHVAATCPETPEPVAPGPEPQGAAPAPGREPGPQGPDTGRPCSPTAAPAGRPAGVPSAPSSPSPPPKAQGQLQEPRPAEPVPPLSSGPTAAGRSPLPLPEPPRSKDAEHPDWEPEGAPLAGASPGSPTAGERGEQAPEGVPEQPRPAERRPCALSTDALQRRAASPSLQEATRLIQEEFAFDGYLDNGLEAWIMGEYIYALRGLSFATFCGAVSEKFCDLYWGDRLLQSLFKVVNGTASPPGSASEAAGSQPEWRFPAGMPSGCTLSSQRPSLRGAGREGPAAARVTRAPCPPTDVGSDALSRGNLEVGFRSQKSLRAEKEQPPVAGGSRQRSGDAGPPEATRARGAATWRPGAEGQSCSPGWSSAFYEADCFGADVHKYAEELGRPTAGGGPDAEAQRPELEQQLMIEKRNYRKTLKFYQKLLQKEKRNKGSEVKTMLPKLRGQLEEMKSRVQFLGLVKKYLQVLYAERWGLEPCALPVIVNIAAAPCDTLDFSPLDESSSLVFYNVNKHPCGSRQRKARVLQAGTPLGLMAYLYSSDAFLEGYVQQFLYTFRYFCTPHDFLQFLLDRISGTLCRAHQDPSSTFTKIYKRSFCLLQAWVEDCYTVDFTHNAGLLGRLEAFISDKVRPLDSYAERLLALLEVNTGLRGDGARLEDPKEAEEDARPLNALCKRLSEDGLSRKSFSWRLPKGSGLVPGHPKERQYSIASALPKPCFLEEFYGPYAKGGEKGPCFLTQCSTHQLSSQLTLLQQELFQKCHPVHFLNSRALGVMDKSAPVPNCRAIAPDAVTAKACSLFLPNYTQDRYLLQLLRNADDVSTWVAAEIVTCSSPKLQVNLLSKFLLIAKSCYEQRDFATAMQILGGLEHLVVRQAPAWRILPAKIAEVMEELKAVEVFLKSDSLCLMEGRRFRAHPTLPSARLLAMHIQQLETGGFTMTNGAHRWSKLRNIAKVASQVHAFQDNPYTFAPDPKLQSCLRQRIARFSGADVSILAADNRTNFHQVASEKHSRKIQDKLRRMKATFQ
ncbi:kinase non-catalytic C-lobe domain-containing protein 1 [Dasypus novemcinctus]|uniref:kinase non-catalytic C-lobe domain-containing protein 1 n=1 Tax=Dasypus novemcinctus TaxID=9361 RepID=UPI00265F020C|nr:kinase non-catalytic C-lobe domain-containing protein 1 [Dasypus novemcinctus]